MRINIVLGIEMEDTTKGGYHKLIILGCKMQKRGEGG